MNSPFAFATGSIPVVGTNPFAGLQNGLDLHGEQEDQRAYPRISGEIRVAFRNAHGQHCAATLRDLSPEGLQITCNTATAQIIHTTGGRIGGNNQPLVQVTMVLPLSEGQQTLSACARLQHAATLRAAWCLMGFQFLELRPKARRLIDVFYAEQLHRLAGPSYRYVSPLARC